MTGQRTSLPNWTSPLFENPRSQAPLGSAPPRSSASHPLATTLPCFRRQHGKQSFPETRVPSGAWERGVVESGAVQRMFLGDNQGNDSLRDRGLLLAVVKPSRCRPLSVDWERQKSVPQRQNCLFPSESHFVLGDVVDGSAAANRPAGGERRAPSAKGWQSRLRRKPR